MPDPLHRRDILDAAERLLGRHGYRQIRVEDIAREAGVAKSTVYLHFDSKEAALLATVDRIVDAVCEEMTRIVQSDGSAADRIREILLARITIRIDRVASYRVSLNELLAAIRPTLLERRLRHFERESAILTSLVASGQASGEFAPGDPARLARSMLLATSAFLPYALSPQELGDRRRLEHDAREVIELLVRAIVRA
ncbi:MAG TPA: TetR/AcrR family transcriptional regulator [Thermoanaerobaculia bacterium]|nr:TetR/AcrR family transcriptional regulator [Thermoanaerobaculia bacterium]